MFKGAVVTALTLLSAYVSAQDLSITGTVKDGKSMQVLSGASVQLVQFNRIAVADYNGRFQIEKLAPGEYTILVSFLGYQNKTEKVTLSTGDVALDILLEESLQFTDEVVVYATRANEKTPTAFTNVSRKELQEQNFGQDMPYLLNWTPSLVTTSDAGAGIGYTGLRIRGSDATRINVTINGIPYNDSESQGTFWVDIPDIASSTQSVQVQRGVGTSTNGSGAFGASINLQTNTRNESPYAENVFSVGSFRSIRNSLSFGTGLLNDHWIVDGRISRVKSDGFIDRASADLESYYFSAGYFSNNTTIKGVAFGGRERTYQAWYGVPESRLNDDEEAMYTTAMNEQWNEEQTLNLLTSDSRTFNTYTYENQVDNYQQDNFQLHFIQRLMSLLTANLSLHYTPGQGYYEEYRYDNDFGDYGLDPVVIGDSVIASSDLVRRRWLDNDFYGFTYSLNYDADHLKFVYGGGWNRYDCDHFGEIIWAEVSTVPTGYQYYFNNGDKRDFNTYAKATVDFTERFTGFIDLQYRRVNYETAGIENKQNVLNIKDEFNFFNPKAGLTYFLSEGSSVYGSYSHGNREPVRDDFVDAPNGRTPKHETLNDIEFGFKKTTAMSTLNANFYLMLYSDQLVLTGQLNDVGASVRTNVDESYRAGVELEYARKISQHFTWNANVTFSQNKIREFTEILYDYGPDFEDYIETKKTYKDTDISFSPSLIAGSALTYSPFKNFQAAWLVKYVGKQFLDNTANKDRSIDAYLINDARITYSTKLSFMKEFGISLLVNNFLNELYESNGYTWGYLGGGSEYRENYYFPQAGTNFMLMVSLKF